MPIFKLLTVVIALVVFPGFSRIGSQTNIDPRGVTLDDFEAYNDGGLPTRWKYIDQNARTKPVSMALMNDTEWFKVVNERGNKYVKSWTHVNAHRLILVNRERYQWNLHEMPRLSWNWRAVTLPAGAREDVKSKNDTGGAVYVTFSRDFLGRPKSIKYTYSSTLPVGTVVDFGRMKALVVSSGKDGIGSWQHMNRDVVADYRRLFGEEPPEHPLFIMIWNDSDTLKKTAEVDFDDFRIGPR